jgi:TonB family protein
VKKPVQTFIRILFAFFLIIWSHNFSFGQSRTVTVRVLDAKTQKPINGANVLITNVPGKLITNYLGYFEQTISSNIAKIEISHIGYQTNLVELPSVDKFAVLLMPLETKLNSVDLRSDLNNHQQLKSNIFLQPSDTSENEIHASFEPSWEAFYDGLKKSIINDPTFVKPDIDVDVHFTINKDGTVADIFLTPDSVMNSQLIRKAFMNFSAFRPARQNKKNVAERFVLKLLADDHKIFVLVENPPEYPGGYEAMMEFIRQNLNYPKSARREGIEGTVSASFVVNKDGSLTDIRIDKGLQQDCDDEVIWLIGQMPKWKPGFQSGKPVDVRFSLPVKFKLNNPSNNSTITRSQIESPSFPGGFNMLNKYLNENKKQINQYPPPNLFSNVVSLSFTVDTLGRVVNIHVEKSLGTVFDNEAIRLFSSMPPWNPARVDGKARNFRSNGAVDFNTIPPDDVVAAAKSFNKGLRYAKKEKDIEALQLFDQAILKDPTRVNYFFNRAVVLIRNGKVKEGCADLSLIRTVDVYADGLANNHCKGK